MKSAPEVKPADELEKLREQIAQDMQAAEKKLKDSDAGGDTQQLQKQVLENLDKLLERAKNPPPPSESPMSGSAPERSAIGRPVAIAAELRRNVIAAKSGPPNGDNSNKRAASSTASLARWSRPPGPGANGNPPPDRRMTTRTGPAESLADVAKDIWGNLPDTLRQEFDHYYREQFMPRYRDLLQQYYLRLAETEHDSETLKP